MTTEVLKAAQASKAATVALRQLPTEQKNRAIEAIASALLANLAKIIEANVTDVEAAKAQGIDPAIVDRLTLNESRIREIADAARKVASLPDPVGESIRAYTLPNGLHVNQVRVPLGVVPII